MDHLTTTSRYKDVGRATLEAADGRTIAYLKRRFLPPAGDFVEIQAHTVEEGERLDQIAGQYLGDPEQFWRICDANNAMRPDDLTAEVGRKLRVTLPEGVQGSPYAQ